MFILLFYIYNYFIITCITLYIYKIEFIVFYLFFENINLGSRK